MILGTRGDCDGETVVKWVCMVAPQDSNLVCRAGSSFKLNHPSVLLNYSDL